MTYTCKRTGETFATQGVAESIHGVGDCDNVNPVTAVRDAIVIPPSESSPGGFDTRARDASGNLITNQIGSQFWMDAGYAGEEPTLAVKAATSQAEYGRDWISAYTQLLAASGADLSTSVGKMTDTYPQASAVVKALWAAAPGISPQAAYDQRLAQNSVVNPTAQGPSSIVTAPASAADPGIITGSLTKIGNYSAAVIAVIAIVVFGGLYLLFGRNQAS